MTDKLIALVPNRRYRVIFHDHPQRQPREMVADYIGRGGAGQVLFSGRPIFGTTPLDPEWVKEVWETERPILRPAIYRGETRVF